MIELDYLFLILGLLLYGFFGFRYFLNVSQSSVQLANRGIWFGFLFHGLAIIYRAYLDQALPFMHTYGILISFSWTMVLIGLLIAKNLKLRMISFLILFMSIILIVISFHMGKSKNPDLSGIEGVWVFAHVLFCFIGYAGLTLACLSCFIYLFQDWHLKQKSLSPLFKKFPDLNSLEVIHLKSILISIWCLAIGLLLGYYWSFHYLGHILLEDPKILTSMVTWISYVALFLLKKYQILRGRNYYFLNIILYMLIIFILVFLKHESKYQELML